MNPPYILDKIYLLKRPPLIALMIHLNFYIISLSLSVTGVWLITVWGYKLGFLDEPNDRSSHETAIPKGGGIGILAAFVFASIMLSIPKSFWIPAAALSLLSLWGDRSEISPAWRLFFQFGASVVFLWGIFIAQGSPAAPYLLIIPLTVFIVCTANYYNFMDGINGIAGITGVVGFGLLAFYGHLSGIDSSFVSLAICIAIACVGFLPFNMPRAKAFMGDVGSILLGFVFAGMVLWASKSLLDFTCLAIFLFPFYADELTTMVVRLKHGENLTRPHRKHLYQLLANEREIPHWKVSVGYGLFQLIVGVSILIVKPLGGIMVLLLIAVYFSGFVAMSSFVRRKVNV